MNKKVLIAMSGGVDSSIAAYLMKEREYDCIGVTMKLYQNDMVRKCANSCCSLEDVEDARSVAYNLRIPYYVFNFTADFNQHVISRFVNAYENGITPNPCIDCNRYLKFDRLYKRARELGCEYVITGHYARIEKENGRYLLKKATDTNKDQSYVLYSMTQDQLAHTMFPLEDLCKSEVRRIANECGFYNADKPDSQDICFVTDGDYSGFIRKYTGKEYISGNFIDKDGNILGKHNGIINYTIGQRKGLGISTKSPLYVTKINPEDNSIVLGSNEELFSTELDATEFNFIAYDTPPKQFKAKAKVRYRQIEQPAYITVTGIDTVHISFEEPQRAITKGQAVVLYDDDVVIGGGIIS